MVTVQNRLFETAICEKCPRMCVESLEGLGVSSLLFVLRQNLAGRIMVRVVKFVGRFRLLSRHGSERVKKQVEYDEALGVIGVIRSDTLHAGKRAGCSTVLGGRSNRKRDESQGRGNNRQKTDELFHGTPQRRN